MRKFVFLSLIALAFVSLQTAKAQYPQVPDSIRIKDAKMMQACYAHSDSAWQVALPIVKEQAMHGKPYIPWAHRPSDLPQASIPAFPGAMGGGEYSFGGRGGKVYTVTNLNDSGPGSFRWACEQGGARIIVFNVSGIIHLHTPVIIRAPYVTIAGQTAPGDGVIIAGESVWINTHDVVIRYMRFMRGITDVGRRDDALGGDPVGNIIVDHCSGEWGGDESISLYRHMYNPGDGTKAFKYPTVNLTIQNSLIAQTLDTWNHAFGSTLGGRNCTFMRNMWADCICRNPSIGEDGIFNFVNNVLYNWVSRSVDGGDYTALYNIINNYYKPGPCTPKNEPISYRILRPDAGRSKLGYKVFGRVYCNGNYVDGYPAVTKDNWDGGVQLETQPLKVRGDSAFLASLKEYRKNDFWSNLTTKEYYALVKWNKPFPMPKFPIMSAQEAYNYVLENVGATLPVRDITDQRIIEQVRTGKAYYDKSADSRTYFQFKHRRLPEDSYKEGIITDISQVGGYPKLSKDWKRYKDSDGDGIPDWWEIKYGLNPHNPADANGDINGDGYTNIEKYINGIDPTKKVDWTNPKNNRDVLAGKTKLWNHSN
ncbi:polysaccharide lyase [Microbacter margulisiae]|uniref:Polysaccharide lyase n=1 Tax=Microbacter margulisiae TaxID=1350067 RepID=A0A7W5DQ39_9PORP|nr:polysaccharide lyase [Microbacter margulisiae]MBB3186987.1 hypothetical protein [Microbacter margulisiae]